MVVGADVGVVGAGTVVGGPGVVGGGPLAGQSSRPSSMLDALASAVWASFTAVCAVATSGRAVWQALRAATAPRGRGGRRRWRRTRSWPTRGRRRRGGAPHRPAGGRPGRPAAR